MPAQCSNRARHARAAGTPRGAAAPDPGPDGPHTADLCELAEHWREPVRHLCVRMTGDAHLGEDLAQEAFRRLLRRPAVLDPSKGRPATFLWKVAVNLCRDELRRRRVRSGQPLGETAGAGVEESPKRDDEAPASAAIRNEEGALVRQAVMQLPEQYREVLILRHFHELKRREIAEVLEIPEGTVSSRLAEAIVRLTALLKPLFGDPPRPGAGRFQE